MLAVFLWHPAHGIAGQAHSDQAVKKYKGNVMCVNAEHVELQAGCVMLRSFQHRLRGKPPAFTRGLFPVRVCHKQDE